MIDIRQRVSAILILWLAGAVGCSSSAGTMAVSDPTRHAPPAGGSKNTQLYVIPHDSLCALAKGTPVEVVLLSGASVLGTPLHPQPNPAAEFHLHAAPRRMFERRDTVRISIAQIEVAVSSVPLVSGSPLYVGPRNLRPLPGPGESFDTQMRPAIVALALVALGAFAIFSSTAAK